MLHELAGAVCIGDV